MTIFAREHEIVTCVNGHPVLEVVNDLVRHEQVRAVDFRSAPNANYHPVKHSVIRPCIECGGAFFRWGEYIGSMQFHFEDGWRPS